MGVTTKLGVIAAAEFVLPKDHCACWITLFASVEELSPLVSGFSDIERLCAEEPKGNILCTV